jgi:hypothetical protein
MEVSLKVSGKYLAITAAALGTVIGVGLGYRSYVQNQEDEAALASVNQPAAATVATENEAAASVQAAMR